MEEGRQSASSGETESVEALQATKAVRVSRVLLNGVNVTGSNEALICGTQMDLTLRLQVTNVDEANSERARDSENQKEVGLQKNKRKSENEGKGEGLSTKDTSRASCGSESIDNMGHKMVEGAEPEGQGQGPGQANKHQGKVVQDKND